MFNTWHHFSLRSRVTFQFVGDLKHIKKAVEIKPLSTIFFTRYSVQLEEIGRFDEAMVQYQQIIELEPTFAYAYERVGRIYASVFSRYDKAIEWFHKTIKIDPKNPSSIYRLSILYLDIGDYFIAEKWVSKLSKLAPKSSYYSRSKTLLHMYQGKDELAFHAAKDLETEQPVFIRNLLLIFGRIDEARKLYIDNFPELMTTTIQINGTNYQKAINFAYVLQLTDESEQAELLLKKSFAFLQSRVRLGATGYGINDFKIYALQGKKDEALKALREAVDSGWSYFWRYDLKFDPNLSALHNEPEYKAIVQELENDMEKQLVKVREVEAKLAKESVN